MPEMKISIAVINGANLNLLGKRETSIYGKKSFEEFFRELVERFPQAQLTYFQSNHEGELIDFIHKVGFTHAGIVLNAGAYTHTSVAIADAVAAVPARTIEVHISNVFARENFRHKSYISAKAGGILVGLGLEGYALAIQFLLSESTKKD
jgi:3-dehydroquinate dehydratase-2